MTMQLAVAILLAMIQGLTEFIPISSSGHLAITQYFLKFEEPAVAFDVVLHLGTLLAVFVFYRKDLLAMSRELLKPSHLLNLRWNTESPGKLLLLLILATMPTAFMGLFLKSFVENAFSDIQSVAFGFLIGGGIMILTIKNPNATRSLAEIQVRDVLLIGTFQGIALFPGISRSGSTISAALLLGLRPDLAGRFSFLLSVPAILGAVVLQLPDVHQQMLQASDIFLYAGCGVLAGVVGYFSISPLIRLLQTARFYYFSFYCWFLGISLLVYLWLKTT